MTRPSKRTQSRRTNIGKAIRSMKDRFVDILTYVFSVIVEGISYITGKRLFGHHNISTPDKKTFYKVAKQVDDAIHKYTQAQVALARHAMKENSTIKIDGSWDHRRHGSLCVVTVIDASSNKIVDYEIVAKKKQYVEGNTTEPSGNLEMIGVARIAERWKEFTKATRYIHDNDGKTRSVIQKSGWKINEFLDF